MEASGVFNRRFLLLLPLLLTLLVVSSACSTGSDDESTPRTVATSASASSVNAVGGEVAERDSGGGATGAATDSAGGSAQPTPGFDRLVVRTAQIDLSVADVAGSINAVRDQAASNGGFVFSSSSQMRDDAQFAQITIRVPADRLDATMSALRSASWVDAVQREESSTQDVSAEYVDNAAQLTSLRTTQTRYLALLEQAESVDNILRLETELQNVRTRIEQIQGRQNYLDNATSYSTITVSLTPVGSAAQAKSASFNASSVFERAWENSRGAIEGLLAATVTLAIFTSFLLPLAAIVFVAWRLIRSRGNGRQATGL